MVPAIGSHDGWKEITMLLKLMSDENIPDDDPRKCFTLIEGVVEAEFMRQEGDDEVAYLDVTLEDGEKSSYELGGNVYLMTAEGAELANFGIAPYHPVSPFERLREALATAPAKPRDASADVVPLHEAMQIAEPDREAQAHQAGRYGAGHDVLLSPADFDPDDVDLTDVADLGDTDNGFIDKERVR